MLREALGEQVVANKGFTVDTMPSAADAFYRQLDFMVATLAVEDFRALYGAELDVRAYAAAKDGIFARYRAAAEALGVLLVRAAQLEGASIMVETSGRDLASFAYVDHMFPDGGTSGVGSGYQKLVVHFTINDLSFAENSVDTRMARELAAGAVAVGAGAGSDGAGSVDPRAVVAVNAGGPYGSEVLSGVQSDSDQVWAHVSGQGRQEEFGSWLKARVAIGARSDGPWTARAVRPGGELGSVYEFSAL